MAIGGAPLDMGATYDVSDMIAQLGSRAIMDVLGALVEEGHLGSRKHDDRDGPRQERAPDQSD